MATFDDTPKWKTRQAYERAKLTPKPEPKKPRAINAPCPVCRARPGQRCTSVDDAHPARIAVAVGAVRWKRARQRGRTAAQKQRWAAVTVRYECPICGGDHSRAGHAQLVPSVFDFGSRAVEGEQR